MHPTINQIKAALNEGPERIERMHPRVPRKRDYFYVRDASDCPVAVWMDCQGMPRPPMPSRVLALQQRGKDLEAQALASIRAYYPETRVHIPTLRVRFPYMVPNNGTCENRMESFFIAGRPDAFLYTSILEIKSVDDQVLTGMTKDNLPQRHRDQLLLYGEMFGLRDLVLIAVSRNDHRHRVFHIPLDPDRCSFLLSRLGLIAKALKDGVRPERDEHEPCQYYCPCFLLKESNEETSPPDLPESSHSLRESGEAAGRDNGPGDQE